MCNECLTHYQYPNQALHINCSKPFHFVTGDLALRFYTSNQYYHRGYYNLYGLEIGVFQGGHIVQAVLFRSALPPTASSDILEMLAVEQLSMDKFLASTNPLHTLVMYQAFQELFEFKEVNRAKLEPSDPILPKVETFQVFNNTVETCAKLILKQLKTNFLPAPLIKDLDNLFREKKQKRSSRASAACIERLLRRILRRVFEDKMEEYSQFFAQQSDAEMATFERSPLLTSKDAETLLKIRRIQAGEEKLDDDKLRCNLGGLSPSFFCFPCKAAHLECGHYYPLFPHRHRFNPPNPLAKFGEKYPQAFYAWAAAWMIPISKLVVFHCKQAWQSQEIPKEHLHKVMQEVDAIAGLCKTTPIKKSVFADKDFLQGRLLEVRLLRYCSPIRWTG